MRPVTTQAFAGPGRLRSDDVTVSSPPKEVCMTFALHVLVILLPFGDMRGSVSACTGEPSSVMWLVTELVSVERLWRHPVQFSVFIAGVLAHSLAG